VRNGGNAQELAALMGRIEGFGKAFFAPLSVVVLVMGVGMAMIGGIMSAPWVSMGFVGIFVSAGIGMGYLTPKSRQLKTLIERQGAAHPDVLLLIVAVMVFKPGAV
jgi:hypothetical protein